MSDIETITPVTFSFFGPPDSPRDQSRPRILQNDALPSNRDVRLYCEKMVFDGRIHDLKSELYDFAERFPESDNAALMACVIAEITSDQKTYEKYQTRFVALGGTKRHVMLTRSQFARIRNKPQRYMDLMKDWALQEEADRSKAVFQYAMICLQYNELDRVREAISLAEEGALWTEFLNAIFDAAIGQYDEMRVRVKRWIEAPDAKVETVNFLEYLWMQSGDPEIFAIYQKATQRWIDHPKVIGRALVNKLAAPVTAGRTDLPQIEKINGIDAMNCLDVIDGLIDCGEVERAKILARQFAPHAKGGQKGRLASFEDLIELLPKNDALQRAPVLDKPDVDWILTDPVASNRLCIIFTGLNGKPTVGLETLDKFMAAWGYQALYLKDFNRLAFAKGIMSCGPNREVTLNAIRRVIADSGCMEPIVLGTSLGSSAAVDYGLDLDIRRMLVFGYNDRSRGSERWRLGDARGPLVGAREHRFFNGNVPSIKDRIASLSDEYKIDVFFGDENPSDAYYASALSDLPAVTSHVVEGSKMHDTLRPSLSNGTLKALLA